MKTTKLLLCFAVLVTAFSACKKDTSTTGNRSNCTNSFGYLANGHSLRYMITFTFSDDTVFTQAISSTTTSGIYQLTNVSDQGSYDATNYAQPCSGKLYNGSTIAEAQTTANYNRLSTANTGDTWTETVGQTVYEYAIVANSVPVTVAAGFYTCTKMTYHQRNTANTDTIYFNPAVGEVKYDGFLLSYELESKNF